MNPNAIALIAFSTVIGHLCGNAWIGAAIGLGIVIVASIINEF
jgi:hypothetical protein